MNCHFNDSYVTLFCMYSFITEQTVSVNLTQRLYTLLTQLHIQSIFIYEQKTAVLFMHVCRFLISIVMICTK